MWISDDAQFIVQQQGQSDQYPYEGKTYTLKVNVYSTAVDIGKSTAVLRKNVDINSLQLGTDVLVSANDHYVAEVVIEPNETSVSKTLIIDTVNPNARVSVTEASAINNNRSKTEKLSTSKNLTLGLGSNDYNIVVTSEDGSVSKPYTLTVTGKLPEYQVTLTGSNVTINPSSVTIGYNSTNTATVTVENNYYLDSVTCTNGYTVTAQTGTSATGEQTVTINNNGNAGGSTCTFTPVENIPDPSSFATDSWATIQAAVQNNDLESYTMDMLNNVKRQVQLTFIVDGETVEQTHYLRIINTKRCEDLTSPPVSTSGCGFVVEFADGVGRQPMNTTATNVGGYPGTDIMFNYVTNTVYNALPADLKAVMVDSTIVSGHGSSDRCAGCEGRDDNSNYITTNQKLYLLSRSEIDENRNYDTAYGSTRQVDFYSEYSTTPAMREKKDENGNACCWWTRTPSTSNVSQYYLINMSGGGVYHGANEGYNSEYDPSDCVSPAFRVG